MYTNQDQEMNRVLTQNAHYKKRQSLNSECHMRNVEKKLETATCQA